MDEMIKSISDKTGLSEDMARQVTEVVLEHLKDKLPAPIAGQIDKVLRGGDAPKGLEDLTKSMGSIFGK